MEEADVVIVGAGIAGLAAALALKIVGVQALVLERGEGLRTTGAALGLSKNAWVALDVLGVGHKGHGQNPVMRQLVSAGERAGFVPLNDKELYWFLTYVFSSKGEDITHDPELIKREVIDHLAKDLPPEYLSMVEHSELSTVTWSELLYRRPWDVIFGNLSKGNVTVAGDAMHAMIPDLGQGGCSALEDVVVLGRHIEDLIIRIKRLVVGDQLAEAFRRYANERRRSVAGLITASYLSGWVQVNNSGWLMKFLRDMIFYKFLYKVVLSFREYDCGKLPSVPSNTGPF